MNRCKLFVLPLLATALSLIVACAPSLTAAGRQVSLKNVAPSPRCQSVGPVKAAVFSGNMGPAKVALRNSAGGMGANYVQLATSTGGNQLAGTAFKCP